MRNSSVRESGTQRSPSEYAQDLVEFMNELNEEYKEKVKPLKSGFGHREEADEFIQAIEADKHIIIS